MSKGATSVNKNLEKSPDNKGLQTAKDRLQENQERADTRKSEAAEREKSTGADRSTQSTRPERSGGGSERNR